VISSYARELMLRENVYATVASILSAHRRDVVREGWLWCGGVRDPLPPVVLGHPL
jgi:hypothetical protein